MFALLHVAVTTAALAQPPRDVVYLQAGKKAKQHTRWSGQIIDYTGRELSLRMLGDRVRAFPSSQVVRIETQRSRAHDAGNTLFERGDYRSALAQYRSAMTAESRRWVQRQILAQLVWCARRTDQIPAAVEYFRMIYAQDPTTQYLDCIPLAWSSSPLGEPIKPRAAATLLNEQSPAAALIGASYLLSTQSRGAAVTRLQRLATGKDKRIALLAQAQIWRTESVTANQQTLRSWQAMVQRSHPTLRAGPYFVLAQAVARQQQYEQAALLFLRVPTLFGEQHDLSARSLAEAGRMLDKLKRPNEAAALYRQLIAEHPQSSAANEARSRLQRPTP
jgi:tetratricopeptide (TPR) repeat protein